MEARTLRRDLWWVEPMLVVLGLGGFIVYAIMDGADLSAANFSSTDLTNTSLKNSNLSGALFKDAIVGGADFSGAEGLSSDVEKYLNSKGGIGL